MPRFAAFILSSLALALLLASPAAAHPQRGHCLGGLSQARCWVWSGRVVFVADGDTIDVRLDDTHQVKRIRMTGINAQELRVYSSRASRRRGECHGVAATDALARLLRRGHNRVRLYAQDASSHSGKRTRRMVGVRIGGHWVDTGARQVAAGLALWLPNLIEYAWNRRYDELSQRAALRHAGMFNPRGCGRGPSAGARFGVVVNWNPVGDDATNVNGEWVRIRNLDPARPVHVGGWVIRASDPQRFHLPRWAVVPAGGAITLHTGYGPNSGNVFHWRQPVGVFNNVDNQGRGDGDGAYLFDPRGNIRAYSIYPCLVACADPLAGRVRISAAWDARQEYVALRNASDRVADLDGYVLNTTAHGYAFGENAAIPAGAELRVYMNGSPSSDTPLVKHWGLDGPSLKNGGDYAKLLSVRDVTVACTSWGAVSCR